MSMIKRHAILEKSPTLLLVFSFLVVTVGGIVEIAPLFYLENTIEEVDGVRPYSPLELTGREIYMSRPVCAAATGSLRSLQMEKMPSCSWPE